MENNVEQNSNNQTDLKKIIAKNLIGLRTNAKLTQLELAKELNYSDKAISKWELGTTLPETDRLISISTLFSVSIDSLLLDSIDLNTNDSMERVVLKFLSTARDMDELSQELVDITCDGVIEFL